MTERPPLTVGLREWEGGLWWMVLASGGLHLLAILVVVLIPYNFAHHPPALVSYTVDLVAPDRVGGSNVIEGGKGRVEAPPLVAAAPKPKVEPPKPPPPKVEEAKPPEPKPPPEPEKPKEVAKPEPKPAPPPPEAKPKENEMTLAEKAKPPPPPTVAKAVPSPQAKPAPAPKAVAKAEPAKPPQPKVDAEAARKAKEAAAARQRDKRIAAAIKRVEQQAGARGGGTGQKVGKSPGGPVSVGPGEGAGGTVKGVEYLLYYNQMISRIKQSWAWAPSRQSLEAVARFSITDTGEVRDVRITHPSGDPSYDASVERAVRAVNPLPPPPVAYRKEFRDVEITFTPEQLQH